VPQTTGLKPVVVYLPGGGFVLSNKQAALERRTWAQYGMDTSKVAVWGESAGGYLASLVGTTHAIAEFETPDNPGFSSDVQAVVNQFGPGNLLKFVADPTQYVAARTPPFLHFHGSADNVVPASQSLLLHTALLEQGVESTRYVLTGAKHGDLSAMLGDPGAALPWSTAEILGYITGFLARHLHS
jgi:acetyl esterase/lipase